MRVRDLLLLPLHVAQVATGAKSFAANPIIGSPALNRRGLHVKRVQLAQQLAERRRSGLTHFLLKEHRDHFTEMGYVSWPGFLPDDVFSKIEDEIAQGNFEREDMRQGRAVTRRALIDDAELRERPGLHAAKNDPRLRDAIRFVASYGGEPLLTLQTVLAAAPEADLKTDPQTMLHADTFHPIAKAWLFLRDVGPDDGPFQYVPGSHRMTRERYEWERELSENPKTIEDVYARRGSLRVSPDQLNALGYGAPMLQTVRANTLVVADTHGFHARSPSPRATTRIEIYGSLRRNPFMPFSLPHLAALPGLRGQTDRMASRGMALRARLGGKGTPWKPIGRGDVFEWPAQLPRVPD